MCHLSELDSDLVCSRQIDKIFSCQGLKINEKDQRGFNKQSCFWKRFSSFRKEQKGTPEYKQYKQGRQNFKLGFRRLRI